MTDEEFMLAKQESYNAYNVYQSFSAAVREERARRDNAECDRTIALISKILPSFQVEKRDDGYDRITAYNDGLTFFVYSCKHVDGQTSIKVEAGVSGVNKSTSSIELGIKGLIAELITRLQGVIKAD